MMAPDDPETVPRWVLQEVGRLHLHALALERELAERDEAEQPPT
jgi:hypothetical protein